MGCKTVDDIKAIDPDYKTTDIIDGVWSERLDDLEQGGNMFWYCPNLESFTSDLSSLTDGGGMFRSCGNLTSFNADSSGSPVNLSSLTNGNSMFHSCSKLTSFSAELPSLTNGEGMFRYCKLDGTSVQNVAETINSNVTNNPRIDLGVDISIVNVNSVKRNFGKIYGKGWNVYVNDGQFTDKYAGCENISHIIDVDSLQRFARNSPSIPSNLP